MTNRGAAMMELAELSSALVDAKIRRFQRLSLEEQAEYHQRELAMTADLPEYGALLRGRELLEDYVLGLVTSAPVGWQPRKASTVQTVPHWKTWIRSSMGCSKPTPQ